MPTAFAPVYRFAKAPKKRAAVGEFRLVDDGPEPTPDEIAETKKSIAGSATPVFNLPVRKPGMESVKPWSGEKYAPGEREAARPKTVKYPPASAPSTPQASSGSGTTPAMSEEVMTRLKDIGIEPTEAFGRSGSAAVPDYGSHRPDPILSHDQIGLLVETEGAHKDDLPPKAPQPPGPQPDASKYGMTKADQDILEQRWREWNRDNKLYREKKAEYDRQVMHWKDRAYRRAKQWKPTYPAGAGQPTGRPPFNPKPAGQVFPVQDLGHPNVDGYLKDLGAGDVPNIGEQFTTIREGAVPKHDAAHQALDLLANAMKGGADGKTYTNIQNISPALAQRIPPGHMVVEDLLPGGNYHSLKIHYPEGKVMSYLGRLNEDDSGYR